jgi:hypothetical protein
MKRITLIVMLLALVATVVWGQMDGMPPNCPMNHPQGGPGPTQAPPQMMMGDRGDAPGLKLLERLDDAKDELGLSDKQMEQLKEIRTTFAKEMIDLKAAVDKAEIDVRNLSVDSKAKSADIQAAFNVSQQKKDALESGKISSLLKMRDILTVEQRDKLKDLHKNNRMEKKEEMKKMKQDKEDNSKHGKDK